MINVTLNLQLSMQLTHLDQINAYFAGMEKLLKALPQGAAIQVNNPVNNNGLKEPKEGTNATKAT